MKIPAFLYLRVSGAGQVEGYGLDRQEEVCRAYAAKAGFSIAGIFREEAVSGTKDETERPAFQEMVSSILSNGTRTVIVEALDRLARALRIQETLLIYMASKGVDLHSARTEENITAAVQSDPLKKALIQIQGVFAELEKNQLVRRLRKGREAARRERGRCEGRMPYGSTQEEKHVLRRIRAMRRTRSLQSIADQLNNEGIKTKAGNVFTIGIIHNYLT